MTDSTAPAVWPLGLGLLVGVSLGLFTGPVALALEPVGLAFLDLLKALVLPLVFCTMVSSVTSLRRLNGFGMTAALTLGVFALMTLSAAILGVTITNWLTPGLGFPISAGGIPERLSDRPELGIRDVLSTFIPANLVRAAADLQLLPLLLFALALGLSLRLSGDAGRPGAAVFESLNVALSRIITWALHLAPVGVGSLVAYQLAHHGGYAGLAALLASVGWWVMAVLIGLAGQTLILVGSLYVFARPHAKRVLQEMPSPAMTAFSTASSTATLPVNLAAAERSGLDPAIVHFVLPLGATINMSGTALYEASAALMIAQAYAIPLDLGAQCIVVILAGLAAAGAAGIPEAGLVTMVMVLTAVGLPVEGIGLLLAVDWLLDRFRTTLNIVGDTITAAIVTTRLTAEPTGAA